jgi:hypothetical protein
MTKEKELSNKRRPQTKERNPQVYFDIRYIKKMPKTFLKLAWRFLRNKELDPVMRRGDKRK